MIYELRTYFAAPGKTEDLHQRFITLTLDIFQRLNMEVVGFWTPEPCTPETGDLVYLLRFPDEAAKVAAWSAFQQRPGLDRRESRQRGQWQAGRARRQPAAESYGLQPAEIKTLMKTQPSGWVFIWGKVASRLNGWLWVTAR